MWVGGCIICEGAGLRAFWARCERPLMGHDEDKAGLAQGLRQRLHNSGLACVCVQEKVAFIGD